MIQGTASDIELGKIFLLLLVTETFNNTLEGYNNKAWIDCYTALLSEKRNRDGDKTFYSLALRNLKNLACLIICPGFMVFSLIVGLRKFGTRMDGNHQFRCSHFYEPKPSLCDKIRLSSTPPHK